MDSEELQDIITIVEKVNELNQWVEIFQWPCHTTTTTSQPGAGETTLTVQEPYLENVSDAYYQ